MRNKPDEVKPAEARDVPTGGEVQAAYEAGVREGYVRGKQRAAVVGAWAADELRMLPESFVASYGAMWAAALRPPGDTLGPDTRSTYGRPRVTTSRTSSGQMATRGLAKPQKRKGRSPDWVKNEAMLAEKSRIDRKLRKLGREIAAVLAGEQRAGGVGKCSRCGQFAESDWLYCPADGAAVTREEE